jgi:hypothetical protein
VKRAGMGASVAFASYPHPALRATTLPTRGRDKRIICPSCQSVAGLVACDDGQITGRFPRVPCPIKGRFAIVTNVGRGMRWMRMMSGARTLALDET